jgi:uncharacterized protein
MGKTLMKDLMETLSGYRWAVITGGSSGIGHAFIGTLMKLDADIRIGNLSRRLPSFPEANKRIFHLPCDLSDPAGRSVVFQRLATEIAADSGEGKILIINNSGFGCYGPFPEPGMERTLAMIEVNIAAAVELTGALLPELRRRGGAVVNIASTAAFQPTPYLAAYAATKSFLMNWSLALNEELRGSGAFATAVCPGPTRTAFFKEAGFDQPVIPRAIGQSSEEVVATILRAVRRRRPLAVSGNFNWLTAVISSRLPRVMVTRIAAQVAGRWRLGKLPK